MDRSGRWYAALYVAVTALSGCVAGGSAVDLERGNSGDAARGDAPAVDVGGAPEDDASGESSAPDTSAVDAPEASSDSGGGPCKTECLGVECGNVPNGCGGTLACTPCGGDPGEYCVKWDVPLFRNDVHAAIEAVKATNPPYLDLTDALGESVRVLDRDAFVTAVVAELKKKPVVVIQDPNDGREIRIRPPTSDAAENYLTVTSGGYSVYKYTSTCSPAGF